MNHRTALLEIREGPLCRGISCLLAALLTLQASGCAFHTYKDVNRPQWCFVKEQATVRVTMTDNSVYNGQLAELCPAPDSANVADSSIPASRAGSLSPGTLVITNELRVADTVGFRRAKVITDSTSLILSEIVRLEVRQGATTANVALVLGALVLVAAVFVVAVGIGIGEGFEAAAEQAYGSQKSNAAGK